VTTLQTLIDRFKKKAADELEFASRDPLSDGLTYHATVAGTLIWCAEELEALQSSSLDRPSSLLGGGHGQIRVTGPHNLKVLPEYFDALVDGRKPFEVRKNDRDFTVGDVLRLREWAPVGGYSGRELSRRVTYVLANAEMFGVVFGYVVLGLADARPSAAAVPPKPVDLMAALKQSAINGGLIKDESAAVPPQEQP